MADGARPLRALRHRDFRRFWIAMLVSFTGTQMQNVAINWHVWTLTRSPLWLGAVGLVRVVPIVALALAGGINADARDRRRTLAVTQTVMLLAAAALAALTLSGHARVGWLLALTATTAAAVAFDNPARQALVPSLVPPDDLAPALSIQMVMFHACSIAGPMLGGIALAHAGPGVVYAINAASFLAMLVALAGMHVPAPAGGGSADGPGQGWTALGEGLRFVVSTPILVWTMGLDFAATLFASATALLPIYADRILDVGARGFGVLSAAAALGGVSAALVLSARPLPRPQGAVMLSAIAVFGVATVAFGLSRSFPLTLAALAVTGAADTVSTVIRSTVRQLVTPDRLRGRMSSVAMVFFMGGPQLGEAEAGLVARLFSPVASVVSGGVACMACVAWALWMAPWLRGYTTEPRARS